VVCGCLYASSLGTREWVKKEKRGKEGKEGVRKEGVM